MDIFLLYNISQYAQDYSGNKMQSSIYKFLMYLYGKEHLLERDFFFLKNTHGYTILKMLFIYSLIFLYISMTVIWDYDDGNIPSLIELIRKTIGDDNIKNICNTLNSILTGYILTFIFYNVNILLEKCNTENRCIILLAGLYFNILKYRKVAFSYRNTDYNDLFIYCINKYTQSFKMSANDFFEHYSDIIKNTSYEAFKIVYHINILTQNINMLSASNLDDDIILLKKNIDNILNAFCKISSCTEDGQQLFNEIERVTAIHPELYGQYIKNKYNHNSE